MEREIKETIQEVEHLLDIVKDYDDIIKILNKSIYNGYTVGANEFYEDDDTKSVGFDLDFGNMGFTVYRTEDNGCRLCDNASYYEYDEEDDYTDIIDIKIGDYKNK